MNIHEYQGKAVLKEFGLPVSRGVAIFSADEAEAAAKELGGPLWVVKSQIHAGGRGKGKFKEAAAGEKGGVRLAKSVDEVKEFARADARQHARHDPDRRGRQAGQPSLYRGRLRHRDASSISPCSSTAPPARSPSSSRRKAAWTSSRSRTTRLRRSSPSPSIRPPASCPITAARSPRRSASRARSPRRPRIWWPSSTRPSSRRTWRCSRSTR